MKHGLDKMELAFRLSFRESTLEVAPVRIRSALRSVLPGAAQERLLLKQGLIFTKTRSPGSASSCACAQTSWRLTFQTSNEPQAKPNICSFYSDPGSIFGYDCVCLRPGLPVTLVRPSSALYLCFSRGFHGSCSFEATVQARFL